LKAVSRIEFGLDRVQTGEKRPVSGKKVPNKGKRQNLHEGRGTVRGSLRLEGEDGDGFIAGTDVTDAIPVMVSAGEYVIPEEVVNYLGRDIFDDLIAGLHTPTGRGIA
jgi:hypothetical protein